MLGFFDGDRADQNRLAGLMNLADAVGVRAIFLNHAVDDGLIFFGAVR